ncbi:MAG: GHKL domain-containing protein [Chitinophagaceae bacterium]|nr:GHKL domain-containing protein [Chitinophagaceae bacterium]
MKNFIVQVLHKNVYFILAAAWLFTLAFIITNYWYKTNTPQYLRSAIEDHIRDQEKDFDKLLKNDELITKIAEKRYDEQELTSLIEKPYSFFIYKVDGFGSVTLTFWSSQIILPVIELLSDVKNNQFVSLINGQYEFISKEITTSKGEKLLAAALIPIHKEYFIQNNNLRKEFVNFPEAEKNVAISENETAYPVKSSFGNVLFYLQQKPDTGQIHVNGLSMAFIVSAVIFLMIFIYNTGLAIAEHLGYMKGILFFTVSVFLLRLLTYLFPVLGLRQYDLFDPGVYSSGFILSSLGDLLINVLLFCWTILFVKRVTEGRSLAKFLNTKWYWPLLLGNILLLVVATFASSTVIQSLISDARISFNVTNFFSLDLYSFAGFLVLAAIAFSYFFLSQVILGLISPLKEKYKYITYLLIAITGLLVLTIVPAKSNVELNLYVLLWLLGYVWMMERNVFAGFYSKFYISEVLFWLFIFSISISVIIIYQNQKIELEQRKRTAERLATQADPSGERILSIALTYFDNDFLNSNYYRFKAAASNAYLKDSIVNKNFVAYLNKYDTQIYTFDSTETPLFNDEPVSFDTLNTIYQIEGRKTSFDGLRSFEKAFDKFAYIYRKEIKDTTGNTTGYFFVYSEPKKYKSGALVPELFRPKKEFVPEYSPDYSYAIYKNNKLINFYNDYPFPTLLRKDQVPTKDFGQRKKGDYNELWFSDGDRVVVYVKKDNFLLEGITLFAYIFSTFLFFIFIFRIITLLIMSRLRGDSLKHYWEWNIRMQIHGTIIFISLFSFVVIGVATILFFNTRYKRNNQDRLSNTTQLVSSEMQQRMKLSRNLDTSSAPFELQSDEMEKMIIEISEIHGTDINLYDADGNLRIASNPFVYYKGILSRKMNPRAYYYMNSERMVQYVDEEVVGDINFQSIYSPIRDASGNVPDEAYAYLNIPSFDSQTELKREISNFLVTLINLNAFIFLLAGVIAFFITNRITSSFILIVDKMRQINLGKMNEEITYTRNDEIGGLVKEYNKMVTQLGESANALAKSEREGAWREMARQVAHEIKNPLTPMKLSIQYLQKAIDNNSDNVKELSASVARTLIEQIDHLSKIAADFSQFANIGNAKNEVFDLHEMLYSLTSLYESIENQQFLWKPVHQRVFVMADRTQLNRLFTNLFQNAVEAFDGKDERIVMVSEEMMANDTIIIKVIDNGNGIPEIMRSKIFTPNFTTKSSGTGLGLAMCRTIVEQARGRIWFETKEGEGTTFFVELPVMRVT